MHDDQTFFDVQRLTKTARLPSRAGNDDRNAGHDMFADLLGRPETRSLPGFEETDEGAAIIVPPMRRIRIPTGVAMRPVSGFYFQLLGRSGHGDRNGIVILGGVCDEPYIGEYLVLALNTGDQPWRVTHGMAVCQAVQIAISYAKSREVDQLPQTGRGDRGFGSTG